MTCKPQRETNEETQLIEFNSRYPESRPANSGQGIDDSREGEENSMYQFQSPSMSDQPSHLLEGVRDKRAKKGIRKGYQGSADRSRSAGKQGPTTLSQTHEGPRMQ
ncbi:hypothetical protein NMY22_g11142 [Coprinellus aureogranulatus]|nr:hypothetical protein NMY22_g11142 [Coprinellus aureogranulatus]